ncbi:MAG: S-layer homology domain-containing protein, partial [Patescibacteria group bacterium]
WQKPWIAQAYMLEVVEGYPNGHIDKRVFRPNDLVTRAEATKIALAGFDVDPGTYKKSYFSDVVDWSKPWVEKARLLGIVKGVGGTVFEPTRPMTRAEAAKVVYLLKKYTEATSI